MAPPAATAHRPVGSVWGWRGLALLPPLLFLWTMVVAPVGHLWALGLWGNDPLVGALSAESAGGVWAVWADEHLRGRLIWSVVQAAASTAVAVGLALPMAVVLARYRFVGREAVLRLLMLPFVVPTLVAALGVLALLGPNGHWSAPLGLDGTDTPWLLIYGNVFFNLGLAVRATTDALAQVSPSRVAAARTLGATPWRAFWRVQWPAIRVSVAGAAALVFLYSVSGMGLALVLGGQRWATAEVEVYTLVAHELQLGQASQLAVWMLAINAAVAAVVVASQQRLSQPRRQDTAQLRPVDRPAAALAVGAVLLLLGLVGLAPLVAVAARALADASVWTRLLLEAEVRAALLNTLQFSGWTVLAATALGLCHAWACAAPVQPLGVQAPWPQRGLRSLATGSLWLPLLVSPVTVAFGLLLHHTDWSASLPLLLAAYTLLAYPLVAGTVGQALAALPPQWAAAARTLGASPWRVWWRVILPLLAPALRRGMALAAATALGEFAVSLFLSRPEWTTLTTLLYQRLGRPGADNLQTAYALALLLMVLALGAFTLIDGPRRPLSPTSGPAPLPHAPH